MIDVAIPAGDAALVRDSTLLLVGALLLQVTASYVETLLTGCHDLHMGRLLIRARRMPMSPRLCRRP